MSKIFGLKLFLCTGVPKLLILLTDGSQTLDPEAEDPGKVSTELRKSGVNVIVVGIGSGTNRTELAHMAGGADNAFSAETFDVLIGGDFVRKLTEKSCKVGTYNKVTRNTVRQLSHLVKTGKDSRGIT